MKEEIIEKLKSDYPALENLSEEEVLAKYFEILGHPAPKPTAKKYKTYAACLEKLINDGKICVECYYETCRKVSVKLAEIENVMLYQMRLNNLEYLKMMKLYKQLL